MMERLLEEKLHAIMARPGVVGVACIDKHGLCLSAKGVANAEMSGVISSIADQSRKIDPSNNANPIIRLEAEGGYTLIQKRPDFTLAVFKKGSNH